MLPSKGPLGPLLKSLVVEAPEVGSTQAWLRDKLLERINDLMNSVPNQPFLRATTEPQAFEMHTGKFLDHGLLTLLMKHHLAWHSREAGEPDSFDWVTLHPASGAAMMSILALAVARVKGLSGRYNCPCLVHQCSCFAEQEEAVLQKLLDVPFSSGTESAADATTEEAVPRGPHDVDDLTEANCGTNLRASEGRKRPASVSYRGRRLRCQHPIRAGPRGAL